MRQQRSSIASEIAWLACFFVFFIVAMYAINLSIVPHRFNAKIAIVLAAFVAGIAMIGFRAWWSARKR